MAEGRPGAWMAGVLVDQVPRRRLRLRPSSSDPREAHHFVGESRFHGSLEMLASGHTWPFTAATLSVLPDKLIIRSWVGKERVLVRGQDTLSIAQSFNPFVLGSVLRFESKGKRRHFRPFRPKKMRHALEDAGWI